MIPALLGWIQLRKQRQDFSQKDFELNGMREMFTTIIDDRCGDGDEVDVGCRLLCASNAQIVGKTEGGILTPCAIGEAIHG